MPVRTPPALHRDSFPPPGTHPYRYLPPSVPGPLSTYFPKHVPYGVGYLGRWVSVGQAGGSVMRGAGGGVLCGLGMAVWMRQGLPPVAVKPADPECLHVGGSLRERGLRPRYLQCRRTPPEWARGGGGAGAWC